MTIQELLQVKEELSYFNMSKEELFVLYINERLDKSFKTYLDELESSFNYLETKDDLDILKNLKRVT